MRDVLRIFAKESLSAMRDRHTLLYAVAIPVFVYPLLFLGVAQWLLYRKGVEESTTYRILLLGGPLPDGLESALASTERFEAARRSGEADRESAGEALAGEEADAVLAPAPAGGMRLYFDSARDRSVSARIRVERALEGAKEARRRDAASAKGFDPGLLEVVEIREENAASPAERGRHILSLLFPTLLIVMAVSGALFPAIDCTAGEKERRTAETTLLLPIARRHVLFGKYLAVVAAGGVAAALNLGSMTLASRLFLAGLPNAGFEVRLPLGSILLVLGISFLFLGFVAALLLGAALFARSFREGQSYLTPLFLVFLVPPVLVSQPGTLLTAENALVPIVNATLALRCALEGEVPAGPLLLTALSLASFAALALALAVRLHDREDLHLAEEALRLSRWREFLVSRRSRP